MSGSGVLVCIRINATRTNHQSWGESQYAEGLARGIRRHAGCEAVLMFRGEEPEPSAQPSVLLQIAGPHLEEPVAGMANLLWMISPPNVAPIGMLWRYQALFIGSEKLTAQLRDHGLAADYLPQATECARFHPLRRPAGADEIPLAFVGGYAPRVDRRIILWAAEAGFEPQIWGPGWKDVVPARLWRGERLNSEALAEVYARARILLNSHMPPMATRGFMSNRSYDALASGAIVVSDRVSGFHDPDFPEIRQVAGQEELVSTLNQLLAAPPVGLPDRIALHDRVVSRYGFDRAAGVILDRARALISSSSVAVAAYSPGRSVPMTTAGTAASVADDVRSTVLAAAQEIVTALHHLEQGGPAPLPSDTGSAGIIHVLSADLHEMRQIVRRGAAPDRTARIERIAGRARRVIEALEDRASPLHLDVGPKLLEPVLTRIVSNEPLWAHGPQGFLRERGKAGLPLRPRAQCAAPVRPVGVFLHLYYDELAPVFAARLAHIAVPFRLYVSTDTDEKARRMRAHLPDAEIRVFANRGRDIWPKLYGFADAHARHDIVLHLHGKRSLHSDRLDDWLAHILGCLLGSEGEVNRILSFFGSIPRLGMVVPVTYRAVLGAAHWGANRDIARELARRMALPGPLPDNDRLRFPVGSMFWARSAALRPLQDLALGQEAFPPEAGQVDGTLAHAIERMLGVSCQAGGADILPVMGGGTQLHRKHQLPFTSNRDLREALASGAFND